jgi:type I restriction enzyme S subunit
MTTLEDVCLNVVDCKNRTAPIDLDGDYFAVGTPAMRGNIINYDQARRVSAETFAIWTERLVPQFGDLLFAREAPVGPVVAVPKGGRVAAGQRTMLLRPDPLKVNSIFLRHYLSSDSTQTRILSLAHGSTTPHLRVADVRSLKIDIPSLAKQTAIAEVLGALDDKIAANTKLIEGVTKLGASLFERALCAPGTGNFKLKDIAKNVAGKYLARESYVEDGPYFVYGSNSIMGRHDEAPIGQAFTVLAKIGSYCGNVRWTQRPAWVNNNASAITPVAGVNPWILRHVVERIDMAPHKAGTGQPYIQMGSLFDSIVQVPAISVAQELAPVLENIAEVECNANEENITLAKMRDTLLPQLMSGKLRVKDAENTVEAVI